ncbi:Avidin family protein [Mycena indigotica]|uniref:Avidin family protein n=1 Tax=Mycena indigotica TaxID=2126181 RepID=A0A8H6T4A6_9AGAR|nr:Avidin family protein [Mycena indigotica]KAF7310102.1 Avidin family protein [Mycena indigotica]
MSDTQQAKVDTNHTRLAGTWTAVSASTFGAVDYTLTLAVIGISIEGDMTGTVPGTSAIISFEVGGIIDPTPRADAGPAAGYAAAWTAVGRAEKGLLHATTSWSAQFFPAIRPGGADRIVAQWVIAGSTRPGDAWESPNVGSVEYRRATVNATMTSARERAVADVVADNRLKGTWYNELGSHMVIRVEPDYITGTYYSKVGDAFGAYPLVGVFDRFPPTGEGASLGWNVGWKNTTHGDTHAATAWAGQLFLGAKPEEDVISTQWLLGVSCAPEKIWAATMLGKDVFTRTQPKAAVVAAKGAHPSVEVIAEKGVKVAQL